MVPAAQTSQVSCQYCVGHDCEHPAAQNHGFSRACCVVNRGNDCMYIFGCTSMSARVANDLLLVLASNHPCCSTLLVWPQLWFQLRVVCRQLRFIALRFDSCIQLSNIKATSYLCLSDVLSSEGSAACCCLQRLKQALCPQLLLGNA